MLGTLGEHRVQASTKLSTLNCSSWQPPVQAINIQPPISPVALHRSHMSNCNSSNYLYPGTQLGTSLSGTHIAVLLASNTKMYFLLQIPKCTTMYRYKLETQEYHGLSRIRDAVQLRANFREKKKGNWSEPGT